MRNYIVVFGLIALIATAPTGFKQATSTPKVKESPSTSTTNEPKKELAFAELSSTITLDALQLAWEGYQSFKNEIRPDRLIIIDFSLPSTEERFFVINPQTGELLFKKLVAHGQGSGELYATDFSNKEGSHQSSLGFLKTAETYSGKHGYSLRLDGLQSGLNSAARERAVVIHQADYVSQRFIHQNGYLGRSWGCPALPADEYDRVISNIEGGTLILIYHPQLGATSTHL